MYHSREYALYNNIQAFALDFTEKKNIVVSQ